MKFLLYDKVNLYQILEWCYNDKTFFCYSCYRSGSTISFVVDEIIATVNKRQIILELSW